MVWLAFGLVQNAPNGGFYANRREFLFEESLITPEQCRAARALLDLSQTQLAERSGVGLRSIQGFEAGKRPLEGLALSTLARFLVDEGIVLVREDGWIGVKKSISGDPGSPV